MQRMVRVSIFNLIVAIFLILLPSIVFGQAPRTINITATKDNKFKVEGQKEPIITAKPSEVLKLHVISFKGPEYEKDGTAHSITIKEYKDKGWNMRLKEGTYDFTVVAPDKPGEYETICDVKCGKGHDDMKIKVIVK
jgi:hypothetical protein